MVRFYTWFHRLCSLFLFGFEFFLSRPPLLRLHTPNKKKVLDGKYKEQHMSKRKIKSVTCFGTLECWSCFSSFNLFFRFHPFSSIMQHPSQQIGGISDISKYPHLRQLWPSHDANNLLPGSFQVFLSLFSSSFSSFSSFSSYLFFDSIHPLSAPETTLTPNNANNLLPGSWSAWILDRKVFYLSKNILIINH